MPASTDGRSFISCACVNFSSFKGDGRNERPDLQKFIIANQVQIHFDQTDTEHSHLLVKKEREFVERLGQARVVWAQCPLLYCQCPLVQWFCFVKLALWKKQWSETHRISLENNYRQRIGMAQRFRVFSFTQTLAR